MAVSAATLPSGAGRLLSEFSMSISLLLRFPGQQNKTHYARDTSTKLSTHVNVLILNFILFYRDKRLISKVPALEVVNCHTFKFHFNRSLDTCIQEAPKSQYLEIHV
jgi:hypothetical protein